MEMWLSLELDRREPTGNHGPGHPIPGARFQKSLSKGASCLRFHARSSRQLLWESRQIVVGAEAGVSQPQAVRLAEDGVPVEAARARPEHSDSPHRRSAVQAAVDLPESPAVHLSFILLCQ